MRTGSLLAIRNSTRFESRTFVSFVILFSCGGGGGGISSMSDSVNFLVTNDGWIGSEPFVGGLKDVFLPAKTFGFFHPVLVFSKSRGVYHQLFPLL